MQEHPLNIYAVLWEDFIPLHLTEESAESAIATAKAIEAKAVRNGVKLRNLRAVQLTPNDEIITLYP